jgi:hypothetical protein
MVQSATIGGRLAPLRRIFCGHSRAERGELFNAGAADYHDPIGLEPRMCAQPMAWPARDADSESR